MSPPPAHTSPPLFSPSEPVKTSLPRTCQLKPRAPPNSCAPPKRATPTECAGARPSFLVGVEKFPQRYSPAYYAYIDIPPACLPGWPAHHPEPGSGGSSEGTRLARLDGCPITSPPILQNSVHAPETRKSPIKTISLPPPQRESQPSNN